MEDGVDFLEFETVGGVKVLGVEEPDEASADAHMERQGDEDQGVSRGSGEGFVSVVVD